MPGTYTVVHGAVSEPCRHFTGNCIAIGDGPNDLQMMEYAGISVAMGNARDEVKRLADMVTDHIDEDGILHAFERLGLINDCI